MKLLTSYIGDGKIGLNGISCNDLTNLIRGDFNV